MLSHLTRNMNTYMCVCCVCEFPSIFVEKGGVGFVRSAANDRDGGRLAML